MGFFLGVDQHLIAHSGRDAKKNVFGDMLNQKMGNPKKSSSVGRAFYRNRSGVVELVGGGTLLVRESRERRDKMFASSDARDNLNFNLYLNKFYPTLNIF